MTGVSTKVPRSGQPAPGDGLALIDLRAVGVRLAEPGVLQFAVNTFGRRAHPAYPAEFDIYIDTNRDGIPDFVVYNSEQGTFGSTGLVLVNVVDLATGAGAAYYYLDADLQSGNAILSVPTEALGITDDTTFDFTVSAFDNYFSGTVTDTIGTVSDAGMLVNAMTYTGSKPRFKATNAAGDLLTGTIAARSSGRIGTAAVAGGANASPSQTGLMLVYRLDAGLEADLVRLR